MEYRVLVLQHESCKNSNEFSTKIDALLREKHVDRLTLSYVGTQKENFLCDTYIYNNKSAKLITTQGNPNDIKDVEWMFNLCKKVEKRSDVKFIVVICKNGENKPTLTDDLHNMCADTDVTIVTFDIDSNFEQIVETQALQHSKSTQISTKKTTCFNSTSYQQKTNSYNKKKPRQRTGDFPDFIKDSLQKKKEKEQQAKIVSPIKNPTTNRQPVVKFASITNKKHDDKKKPKPQPLINKHAFFITGNPDGVNTTHVHQYAEKLIDKYGKGNVVIIGGGTNRIEFIARDVATLHNVEFIDIPLKSSSLSDRTSQIRKIISTLSKYTNAELICFHVGDGFGAQNDLINIAKENKMLKIYYPKSDRDDLFTDRSNKLHFRSKIKQENPNFVIDNEKNENFVIITGDYSLRNYEAFSYLVTKYIRDKQLSNVSIITAHNDGIDSMARRYALEHNHGLYTFVPNLLAHDTNVKDVMCNLANLSLFCYEHTHHHALVITTGKVKGTSVAITIINSKNIKPDIYMCPLKKYVDIDTIMYKPSEENKETVVENSWV